MIAYYELYYGIVFCAVACFLIACLIVLISNNEKRGSVFFIMGGISCFVLGISLCHVSGYGKLSGMIPDGIYETVTQARLENWNIAAILRDENGFLKAVTINGSDYNEVFLPKTFKKKGDKYEGLLSVK